MTDTSVNDLDTINTQILWLLGYLNSDLVTKFSDYLNDKQGYWGYDDKKKLQTIDRVKKQGCIPVNLASYFRDYLVDDVDGITAKAITNGLLRCGILVYND